MNGKQLKNSILQWAIQGKLVPQDPTEEPASALLERIRAEKGRLVKEGKIKKDKNESFIFRGDDNSYYEKFQDGKVVCIDEEIPFELPVGWEWSRIGNIFLHASGKQQSGNGSLKGTPQKYITTSNLYWGKFVLDTVKVMNFTNEEIRTCSATKGDLLVCEGGAGYGRSAIWDKDYDICLQNHIHRLRPCIHGICEYVYHFIYLQKGSNQLSSVGTAMPGLSANKLKGLLIPMPPLEEQKRINSRLSMVLPIVERYSRCQESVDSLNDKIRDKIKQSILQEAIQGKLVCQNPDEGTASALLDSVYEEKKKTFPKESISTIFRGDDNKYYEKTAKDIRDITDDIPFEIPEYWAWTRLKDIVQFNPKNIASDDTIAGFLPMNYICAGYGSGYHVDLVKWKQIKKGFSHFATGDIAFAKITPCFQNRKSFIAKELPANIGAGTTELIVLRPFGETLCREYVLYFLQSPYFVDEARFKGTAGQQRIMAGYTEEKLIPLPPRREQERIVQRIDELFSKL